MIYKSRPVLITFSVLAGLQVLAGGAALGDLIGVTAFAMLILIVGAVQTGMTFYVQGKVVPASDVAAYVDDKGNTLAGPASDESIPNGAPVRVE